jgi:hypothetical protein
MERMRDEYMSASQKHNDKKIKKKKKKRDNGVKAAADVVSGLTGYAFDLSVEDSSDDDDDDEEDDEGNADNGVSLDDAMTVATDSPVYGSAAPAQQRSSSSSSAWGQTNNGGGSQQDEAQKQQKRAHLERVEHVQRIKFLPDQVLRAMQSALVYMREKATDTDLVGVSSE